MNTLQLFYYLVLPLSLAVVGVAYGEVFRARQMHTRSSDEVDFSAAGKNESELNRHSNPNLRNRTGVSAFWQKSIAHVSGTIIATALASVIGAALAWLRFIQLD